MAYHPRARTLPVDDMGLYPQVPEGTQSPSLVSELRADLLPVDLLPYPHHHARDCDH